MSAEDFYFGSRAYPKPSQWPNTNVFEFCTHSELGVAIINTNMLREEPSYSGWYFLAGAVRVGTRTAVSEMVEYQITEAEVPLCQLILTQDIFTEAASSTGGYYGWTHGVAITGSCYLTESQSQPSAASPIKWTIEERAPFESGSSNEWGEWSECAGLTTEIDGTAGSCVEYLNCEGFVTDGYKVIEGSENQQDTYIPDSCVGVDYDVDTATLQSGRAGQFKVTLTPTPGAHTSLQFLRSALNPNTEYKITLGWESGAVSKIIKTSPAAPVAGTITETIQYADSWGENPYASDNLPDDIPSGSDGRDKCTQWTRRLLKKISKFPQENFRVFSEMRFLVNIRVEIFDF